MTAAVLPDVERIVSAALRGSAELADARIYTELPKTERVFPLCRLARIGGGPAGTPIYIDSALIQFDAWGGSKYEARTLAATVAAVLDTLTGYTAHGGYITGVDPGATRYIPDESFTPARPRYVVDAVVHIRPDPVSPRGRFTTPPSRRRIGAPEMAIDTSEIRVGASGSVYVAPLGTELPVEPDDVLDVAFIDLGAINEDGVTLAPSQTVEKIRAWQASKAVRVVKTEDELSISFALMQWNAETVPLALGGGTVSATTGTATKYVPPAAGTVDERTFLVEWIDGAYTYRLVIPRGMVTEVSDIQLTKSAATELPLTVEVLGASPDDFIIFTDDPAWS